MVEVFLLLNRFSRGNWCYIQQEFVGLFPLIIQRSNLDGEMLNLDGRMLTLDGVRVPPSPPYNLSADKH